MFFSEVMARVLFYIGLAVLTFFLLPRLPKFKWWVKRAGRKIVRLVILVKENWHEPIK
jgi:glucose-6-phosphate dehydrogenase assembly protein OpcA